MKNRAAVLLGRRGGVASARRRLALATPADLSAWGRRTVAARWRFTLRRVAIASRRRLEDFGPSLREFYREVARKPEVALLSFLPPPAGCAAHDAYLAAVAEEVSRLLGWAPPSWCYAASRVLPTPYFGHAPEGMKIPLLVSSPGTFRRRNIFVDRNALSDAIEKARREIEA